MKKTKFIAFILALACMASVGSGCGDSKNTTSIGLDQNAITENTMPITEEDITLNIWIRNGSQGYFSNYKEYEVVKKLEEVTGLKFEFTHPVGAAKEQLNIMLASGEMSDIIIYYFQNDGGTMKAVEEGTYIKMADYIDKFAPNFKKLVAENESFKKQVEMNGGKDMTYMPNLIDDPRYLAYNGYFIRQDWLDQVGLNIPETISDWEAVLTAFRDKKLGSDGNTIPFATITSGSMNYEIFASGFGLNSIYYYCLDPDTGKVTHPVLQPGYKDYLMTLNKWYTEGLIDPNIFGANIQQIDSMMLNHELGSVYIDNNADIPKYMQTDPDLNLVAVPYPKDANGNAVCPTITLPSTVASLGAVVTKSCEHPVEAVRFLDYLYSEEGSDLINWGIEGTTYTKDANGEKKFTDLILANPEEKSPTEAFAGAFFARSGAPGLIQFSAMSGLETNYSDEIKKQRNQSIEYSMELDQSRMLGALPFTYDELNELNNIKANVETYITEMHQKFILGKESFENFDSFIENAKKSGMSRMIELRQQAYDRIEK